MGGSFLSFMAFLRTSYRIGLVLVGMFKYFGGMLIQSYLKILTCDPWQCAMNQFLAGWKSPPVRKEEKKTEMAIYMLSDLIIMCSCKNLLLLLNIETAACLVLAHIL